MLVYDNGSEDTEVITGLDWWKKSGLLPLRIVRTNKNRGFVGGCNSAISKVKEPAFVLLSNDIRIQEDIIPPIISLLKENPRNIVGGTLLDRDTGWNKFGDVVYPYLEGWMLAMLKSTWEDIGGFDKRYAPSDFEDVDFSTAALAKKYKLVALNSAKVRHIGGQTYQYDSERSERTERNRERFKEKWMI